MPKAILCSVLFLLFYYNSDAQNSFSFEVGPSVNVGLYDGAFVYGYGGDMKILRGVGKSANQVTLGITYERIFEKSNHTSRTYKYSFSNANFGFRSNYNRVYLELFTGAGIYVEEGDYRAFNYLVGVESGYSLNKVFIAFNYRLMVADGLVLGEKFNILSLKAGLRLP